ncbi:F0F1 ATP synthase subunit delta [Tepidamorphus sp. 3E244]|uniref:F0F1 ATP synthase subunit delta n=1 Tax=Tepidamorphus sp. 3E244 TaxID=3385498 RepID=UPI0038FBF2F8
MDDSIVSGVAGRYANALFDLAKESNSVDSVGKDLDSFATMLDGSDDLTRLVRSPVFSAEDQIKALDAILKKAGISGTTGNFLRLVARNRRLFAVSGMIRAYRALAAADKGEMTASVTTAQALTDAQKKSLQTALKSVTGKTVSLNETVDPSIIGGLVVKVGSRMIDTSIRSKLNSLKTRMKEVG